MNQVYRAIRDSKMKLEMFGQTKTKLLIINPVITDKSNININNTAQEAVEFTENKFWGGKKKADGLDFTTYIFDKNVKKHFFRIYSGKGKGQIFLIDKAGPGYARIAAVQYWGSNIMDSGKKEDYFCKHIGSYKGIWNQTLNNLNWGEPVIENGKASKYFIIDLSLAWRDGSTKVVNGKEVPAPKYSNVVYSMKELREDTALWNFNAVVETKISKLTSELLSKTGMSKSVKLPVIFMAPSNKLEMVGAYSPDLANFKTVNKNNSVFPSQFFAPGNMVDIFETYCKEKIKGVIFADDFNFYHDSSGEVHCATAVKRKVFEIKWWENVK